MSAGAMGYPGGLEPNADSGAPEDHSVSPIWLANNPWPVCVFCLHAVYLNPRTGWLHLAPNGRSGT